MTLQTGSLAAQPPDTSTQETKDASCLEWAIDGRDLKRGLLNLIQKIANAQACFMLCMLQYAYKICNMLHIKLF